MKTKSKMILMGLLTIMILLITTTATFCTQLSETATWTRLEGVAEKLSMGNDVAVDKNGNSYMVGGIQEEAIGSVAFVSKYAANGSKLWTKKLGGDSNSTVASGVALDSAGNCYVVGGTDEVKLDEIKITGFRDTFIVKYKPNGTKEWLKLEGVYAAYNYCMDIAIDKSDNFYIVGYINKDFKNQVLKGSQDLYISKYNSAGTHQWTQLLGAKKSVTNATRLVVDNKSNIYVAGITNGNLDGQNIKIPTDGLIVKYDSNGNKKWTRLIGAVGTGEEYAYAGSIAVDSNGNCFITGDIDGQIDGKAKIGSIDTVIIAYTPDGNKLWSKLLGVKKEIVFNTEIVIDSLNNLYISGTTTGKLGENQIGEWDGFVAKYNADSKEEWIKQFGVAGGDVGNTGIALDKNNLLYVVGSTDTALDGQSKIGLYDAFITTYFNK